MLTEKPLHQEQPRSWHDRQIITGLLVAAERAHRISKDKGFWHEGVNRNKAELIALMHSELSEMLEGVRKPGPDSHCPEFTSEEIELADLLIRALDYAGGFGLRLSEALIVKMAFNATRPHMHGKRF